MNQYYVEGFVKACEARGVDPEALLKAAELPSDLSGIANYLPAAKPDLTPVKPQPKPVPKPQPKQPPVGSGRPWLEQG